MIAAISVLDRYVYIVATSINYLVMLTEKLYRVLSLLHYSRSPSYAIQASKNQVNSLTIQIPLVEDSQWHSNPYRDGDKFHLQGLSTGESYFDLYLPLLRYVLIFIVQLFKLIKARPLDELLINGHGGTAIHTKLSAQLEDYFLSFPVSLMKYQNIRYSFQVEAMIWMHGIYILLGI
jgi:hypothetical protein